MIVKNEEKYLRDCLESVKNIADEIVIVDTGSTDRTVEIAKEYNAKIFYFDWINDFSATRNYALENSTGNWILYMDADERLDPSSADELKKIIDANNNAGFYCTVKSIDEENGRDHSMRYPRLFKNNPGLKFSGKVHEQIIPSLKENKYEIFQSSILINHIGYNVSREEKEKKALRNLELLLKDYEQNKSAYYDFQLGQTYFMLNKYTEAEKHFKIAANSKNLPSDLKAESYSYLAHILHNAFLSAEAERNLLKAIQINPKQAFYYLLLSKIYLRKQDFTNAKTNCKKAFEVNKNNHQTQNLNAQTSLINPREIIYFGLYLAYQTNDKNYTDFFLNEFHKNANLQEKDSLTQVIETIMNRSEISEEIGSALIKFVDDFNIEFFLAAIMDRGNGQVKINLLEKLKSKFNKNSGIIKNLSIIYDQNNNTTSAIEILEQNRKLIENDAGALFYLASFYLKISEIQKSLELFNEVESRFKNLQEIQQKIKAIKERILAVM